MCCRLPPPTCSCTAGRPPKIQNLPPPLEDPTKPGKAIPEDPLNQPKEQQPEDFKKLDKKYFDTPASKPKPPTPLLLPPKELPEGIRGTVTKAFDVENNAMEIDIGADAGLEKGMELTVYRFARRYHRQKASWALALEILGTVTMQEVNPKTAVCKFKPKRNVALDELREEELPPKRR